MFKKLENIFFTDKSGNYDIKIKGFGLAAKSDEPLRTPCGTPGTHYLVFFLRLHKIIVQNIFPKQNNNISLIERIQLVLLIFLFRTNSLTSKCSTLG